MESLLLPHTSAASTHKCPHQEQTEYWHTHNEMTWWTLTFWPPNSVLNTIPLDIHPHDNHESHIHVYALDNIPTLQQTSTQHNPVFFMPTVQLTKWRHGTLSTKILGTLPTQTRITTLHDLWFHLVDMASILSIAGAPKKIEGSPRAGRKSDDYGFCQGVTSL